MKNTKEFTNNTSTIYKSDTELKNKIIEIWKKNSRYDLITAPSYIDFLVKEFEVPASKIRNKNKQDIINVALSFLNADTLMFFANTLENFGLLTKDIVEIFDTSEHRVYKLIKDGELQYVDKKITRDYYDVIVHICSIQSIICSYKDGKFIPKRKARSVSEITDENIAMSLYLINKSAKKSRDTKKNSYYRQDFTICKSAKTREHNLYTLKNDAMNKLISEGKMQYCGIDIQTSPEGEAVFLKSYMLSGYTFHSIAALGSFDESELTGKVIPGIISSEKTRNVTINFNQAKEILIRYAYGQGA